MWICEESNIYFGMRDGLMDLVVYGEMNVYLRNN